MVGLAPGPPQELEEWTRGTFVCAASLDRSRVTRGWDAGPEVRTGPGSVRGKRAGRAAPPGSRRSAEARGPLPTGAAPGPSQNRAGSLLFLASTLIPVPTLAHPGFLPEAIRFPLRPYIEALGPGCGEVRVRSGLSDKPRLGAPLAFRSLQPEASER